MEIMGSTENLSFIVLAKREETVRNVELRQDCAANWIIVRFLFDWIMDPALL